MQYERFLKSNRINIRRKALRRIFVENIKSPEKSEELFTILKNMTNDSNWSIRTTSISLLAKFVSHYDKFTNEAFELLLEKVRDEHPSVRNAAIEALSKIVKNKGIQDDRLTSIIEEFIDHENDEVKIAILDLIDSLSFTQPDVFTRYIDEILSFSDHDNTAVKAKAFHVILHHINDIPDNHIEKLMVSLINALDDASHHVRESAIYCVTELLKQNKMSPDTRIIHKMRKKLRDPTVNVKKAALDFLSVLLDQQSQYAEDFFDIIGKEILLKEKNRKLKQKTLELLKEKIPKIPPEILYRHNIIRALDILEKSTHPKSSESAMLKHLARYILENMLGYDIETRMKKFGSR